MVFNLFIVWLLTGLWHGANWTFIVWGLFYFILIAAEKLSGFEKSKCPRVIKYFYTGLFVIIGWVIFRADNIGAAFNYLSALFGKNGFSEKLFTVCLKEHAVIMLAAVICCFPLRKFISAKVKNQTVKDVLKISTCFVLMLVSVVYITKGTYNPFIYFNF